MFFVRVSNEGFDHPPFTYETLDEALATVEDALAKDQFVYKNPAGNLTIQLGGGTIIKVSSTEAIELSAKKLEAIRRNPLLACEDIDAPWQLILQVGSVQLTPVDVASEEAADTLIDQAVREGVFRFTLKAEHEYLFVQTMPGTVWMSLPTEMYVQRRRRAVEDQMRAMAQQPQSGQGPLIFTPSGGRDRN